MYQEIETFFTDLYASEMKKEVLQGRARGETILQTAKRLQVTQVRIQQIEAKITRAFAMSSTGRNILSAMSQLSDPVELSAFFGAYQAEMCHLLRLYHNSFYYRGPVPDKPV